MADPAPSKTPVLDEFEAGLEFPLDAFQRAACESVEAGRGVLVAAPTGAGKTVIAEFAIALAQRDLRERVFYTAPIKALSNQKFHELVAEYGADQVGLLTGDTTMNGGARIVVMTTEVLRNMIYADSDALDDLAFVVLDEVHFLGDRFRGAVWEEIILHLPQRIKLVSLSATVSNAEEFGDWMHVVRGDTDVIVSEHRPVPLYQHVLTKRALHPLFLTPDGEAAGRGGRLNPEVIRLGGAQHGGSSRGRSRGGPPRRHHGAGRIPRSDIVRALEETRLLPAIVFVFSRNGCDQAVRQCLYEGIRLTTREERVKIRQIVEQHTADMSPEDLRVLGYSEWLAGLERGVAAHHAGLLPPFKAVVETLFQQRLLRVVFATETLALGINMPARCVVVESLEKFNGEARVPLTSGEYTQLTGRAGRRGIDDEGHAVVVWNDSVDVEALAHLAAKRSYPLNSTFRPTYNMTVNLIDRVGREPARELLERSFAQFQADRGVVDLARQVRAQEASLRGYEEAMACHLGDFVEYARLGRQIADLERGAVSGSRAAKGSARAKEERRKELDRLQRARRAHACHGCPDRQSHQRWADRWQTLRRSTDSTLREIRGRTGTIARVFDRVTEVLLSLDYLAKDDAGTVTVLPWGRTLKRIYGDRDLLVAESLRTGIWSELNPAELAALCCALTYEPRRDDEQPDQVPGGAFLEAFNRTVQLWERIDAIEDQHRIQRTQPPHPGLAKAMLLWARGGTLERALETADLGAGDFVRWSKQTIDLLDQIAQAAEKPLSGRAYEALDLVRRGIIESSTVA